jgi:hypothetical protein
MREFATGFSAQRRNCEFPVLARTGPVGAAGRCPFLGEDGKWCASGQNEAIDPEETSFRAFGYRATERPASLPRPRLEPCSLIGHPPLGGAQ